MASPSAGRKPVPRIRVVPSSFQEARESREFLESDESQKSARESGRSPDPSNSVQEWLDLAIRAAKMGAWVWYLQDGVIRISRTEQYDRIMGNEPTAPVSLDSLLNRVHPLDRERVRQRAESLFSGRQEEYDVEYRILTRSGEICWVRDRGRGIRDERGKVIRVTGVVTDITDRKRLERDRDQFVAALSHDLRNPLAAARVGAELILRYPDRKDRHRRLLVRIISSIEQANRLIQNLLDSSRMMQGQDLQLTLERFDLSAFLKEILRELATEPSDRIRYFSGGPLEGYWSRQGIRRIVETLVGNAVRYGASQDQVTVALARISDPRGDQALLTVHNRGEPILESQQSGLFDPFHRPTGNTVEPIPWRRQGGGLGLAVAQGLARAHGGAVEVRSTEPEGTTFTVRLPVKGVRAA